MYFDCFLLQFCVEAPVSAESSEGIEKKVQKPRFKKVALILSGCGVYDGRPYNNWITIIYVLETICLIDFYQKRL